MAKRPLEEEGAWWVEAQLDDWVAAKRAKNFEEADRIRGELRERGISPDRLRPPGWTPKVAPTNNPAQEALLDEWVEAKRNKDFDKADSIREQLRSQGVEPDHSRPKPGFGGADTSGDPEVEAMLDDWVESKRSKDFDRADSIRAELRKRGIEPENARPQPGRGFEAMGGASWSGTPGQEALLDEWVEAKRAKDFDKADSIREQLRAQGVDPDTVRPKGSSAWGGGGCGGGYGVGYPPGVERMLDRWVEAKKGKHFEDADRIRDELRRQGIEPDHLRPDPKKNDRYLEPSPYGYADPPAGGGGWGPGGYGSTVGGGMGGGPPSGSWKIEAQLDEWVAAKRAKDFDRADYIRSGLRSQGIEAEHHRPHGYRPTVAPPTGSAATEALLDAWVEAKRNKDFQAADDIRQQLRAQGVEPDHARPKGSGGGGGGGCGGGGGGWGPGGGQMGMQYGHVGHGGSDGWGPGGAQPWDHRSGGGASNARGGYTVPVDVNRMLDDWVDAKRNKDFRRADDIRAELRSRGISPDKERPRGR